MFWCTTMQALDPHLSVDHHWGFYSTFHGTILRSKSCTWSFTSLGGVNMRLQNHLLHLSLDVLMTPHFSSKNRKSGFHAIRILTTYTTKMHLHGPDELGILQYISEWAKTTDHPGCSHVLSLHSDLELEALSTDGRHLICWNSLLSSDACETSVKATAWGSQFYSQPMSFNLYSNLANLNWAPKSVIWLWHTAK